MEIRKIWENLDLGSRGVWVVILIVRSFKKRVARKVRRFILLHFGLVTFRIHFSKIQKVPVRIIFGLVGRVHGSQNQFSSILETSNYFK